MSRVCVLCGMDAFFDAVSIAHTTYASTTKQREGTARLLSDMKCESFLERCPPLH